jgi:hypothetical protein
MENGMAGTTIPASEGTSVTVGSGDVLSLASTIGALLAAIGGAGGTGLQQVEDAAPGPISPPPTVSGGTQTELAILHNLNININSSIPGGYDYVVALGKDTLRGNDVVLVTNTLGGSYQVTGNSTVAATGGDNTVRATGNYLLSFGPGDNVVHALGVGTVATGPGQSTVVASSGDNLVRSIGTGDFIVGGSGSTTVDASGPSTRVLGGSG